MNNSISYITLAVSNLEAQVSFYQQGFGFKLVSLHLAKESAEDSWAFFDLGGIRLALYDRHALIRDAGISPIEANTGAITLSHNVPSKQHLEKLITQLKNHGASVTRPVCQAPWGGYRGYVKDPEGFLWEIVWSPSRNP